MPALSDYTAGTITLTNGSTAFTGAGTGWQAADFREGDTILGIEDNAGVEYVIATITGNGAGTLTQEWEGATGTYQYRMRYMADGARVTAQARNLIELLGSGNLQAISGETFGSENILRTTGPGAVEQLAFTDAMAELADDTSFAAMRDTLGVPLRDAVSVIGLVAGNPNNPYMREASTGDILGLQRSLGFPPVEQGGGIGMFSNKIRVGWNGAGPLMQVDNVALGLVWVDHLAGRTRSASGYEMLPSGLIVQWGQSYESLSDYNIPFPTTFPNKCFSVVTSVYFPSGGYPTSVIYSVGADNYNDPSPALFSVRKRVTDGAVVAPTPDGIGVAWVAVGY